MILQEEEVSHFYQAPRINFLLCGRRAFSLVSQGKITQVIIFFVKILTANGQDLLSRILADPDLHGPGRRPLPDITKVKSLTGMQFWDLAEAIMPGMNRYSLPALGRARPTG